MDKKAAARPHVPPSYNDPNFPAHKVGDDRHPDNRQKQAANTEMSKPTNCPPPEACRRKAVRKTRSRSKSSEKTSAAGARALEPAPEKQPMAATKASRMARRDDCRRSGSSSSSCARAGRGQAAAVSWRGAPGFIYNRIF